MEAERNPVKVQNQSQAGAPQTSMSLGHMLRSLKSDTSDPRTNPEHTRNTFKSLYQQYDRGVLTRQSFETHLSEDLGIHMNPELKKVLDDPGRDYLSVAQVRNTQNLGVSLKTQDRGCELYDNPKGPRVRSSTELTTMGGKRLTGTGNGTRPSINTEELSTQIRLYAQGRVRENDFRSYLASNSVQVSAEMNRYIKLHAETQSVPYNTLGRVILSSLDNSESELAGNPQYRALNSGPRSIISTAETREAMRSELLQQELDRVGSTHLDHKRRVQPTFKDTEELTAWKPETAPARASLHSNPQLQHHDIFSSSEPLPPPRPTRARPGPSNGNIISWAD